MLLGTFDEVVGVVEPRGGVVHAAKALDDLVELSSFEMFGRFEIEVFEHMGDPRFAQHLVAAAHFIKDIGGEHAAVVVHRDRYDLEAVFKCGFVIFWQTSSHQSSND